MSPGIESSRETDEGKAQKHMAAEIRKDMATAGEGCTGQKALDDFCGWPLPLKGANSINKFY